MLFPRGSEWRKWDLHIHVPGTKLNSQYTRKSGQPDFDQFCRILEESDVSAFGITDYFSITNCIALIERYKHLYPDTTKVLFPVMEVRLNETVNRSAEEVNLHLLFPPSTTTSDAQVFMTNLNTELRTTKDRPRGCNELASENDFKSATVTRDAIKQAIVETFGRKANPQDYLLVITSCKGDGIRSTPGAKRKGNLADEIDKLSDAFFGGSRNTSYFLDPDRLEEEAALIKPKPVISGSDAHSFDQLSARLGKDVPDENDRCEVTWIKADLTFAGLCQTLIEPAERVRIQATRPDPKEPYQVISKVRFTGSNAFPNELVLNPNLISIIGSRSSGKSSLLAHISYAVDPKYTVNQQLAAGSFNRPEDTGPAPGKTWRQVLDTKCEVVWADDAVETGKVIFIPQNSLFALSDQPDSITTKIQPALYREAPAFEEAHSKALVEIRTINSAISASVTRWFRLHGDEQICREEIRNRGDKRAIAATRDRLEDEISELRKSSSLTREETECYQDVINQIATSETRFKQVNDAAHAIVPYLPAASDGDALPNSGVAVTITVSPSPDDLPASLREEIGQLIGESESSLLESVTHTLVSHFNALKQEAKQETAKVAELRTNNAELIAKNVANEEIESLVQSRKKQDELLAQIGQKEHELSRQRDQREQESSQLLVELNRREGILDSLRSYFGSEMPTIDSDMRLGIEVELDDQKLAKISDGFNRNHGGSFFKRDREAVDIAKIRVNPAAFLEELASGELKVKLGRDVDQVASSVLMFTEDVRFFAELDDDRIGGFGRSSMTPGKQALFALTLILNETQEPWPLLIDQPEDDLDSRSIYEHIVPYLIDRKRHQQIIMVTHNANLVVGADSEQVIIANRHGDDRRNRDGRTFDYLSGSLEHSREKRSHNFILSTCGIREHACEILDGGEEAFQKRKDKYRI